MSDRFVKPILLEDVKTMDTKVGFIVTENTAVVAPAWAWIVVGTLLGFLLGIVL
jgi:hypothetical protein